MSNRERILAFVTRFPGRDDDEVSAALEIRPRQQVNQVCRALAKAGKIERRPNEAGKIGNFPQIERTTSPQMQPAQVDNDKAAPAGLATNDWFWEGNVVDVLVQALSDRGSTIISVADTHSKQQGIVADIPLFAKRTVPSGNNFNLCADATSG